MKEALPQELQPSPGEHDPDVDFLLCIASSVEKPSRDGPLSTVHTRVIPCIPGYFSGVGDLFSALVLAHYENTTSIPRNHTCNGLKHDTPISRAVSQALTKTHAILTMTHEHSLSLPEEERLPTDEELDKSEPERQVKRMKGRELKLIQGQDIIRGSVDPCRMDWWTDFWHS